MLTSAPPDHPLPKGWPRRVRSAALHVIALAHAALTRAQGWCLDSRVAKLRLAAEPLRGAAGEDPRTVWCSPAPGVGVRREPPSFAHRPAQADRLRTAPQAETQALASGTVRPRRARCCPDDSRTDTPRPDLGSRSRWTPAPLTIRRSGTGRPIPPVCPCRSPGASVAPPTGRPSGRPASRSVPGAASCPARPGCPAGA